MTDQNQPSTQPTPPTTDAAAPKRKRRQPSAEELSDRRLKRWSELLETVILTVATLAVAWAGYQSGLWGGTQTSRNIEATTQRINATQAETRGQQAQLIDIGLFENWVSAYAAQNQPLLAFYQARFRDEFITAFDAWVATNPRTNPDAPSSPFVMPEYQPAAFAEAAAYEAEAARLTQEGEEAGSISDQYTLITVILAGALLLAGIASRFTWAELRTVIVGLALLVLLFCVVRLLTLPAA